MRNFRLFFSIFVLIFSVLEINAQSKIKDTYAIFTKERVKFFFTIQSQLEKAVSPTDTTKVKFTFSLLKEGEVEQLNDNMFIFKMKYSRPNTITAINNLPENIISKLAINSNKFPPNYELFCREKIVKNMTNVFKQIESNTKLKKVGTFEEKLN
jgi:hypothetical protein